MKAGLKQMKKEYKKINIDKVEDLQVFSSQIRNFEQKNSGRNGRHDARSQ